MSDITITIRCDGHSWGQASWHHPTKGLVYSTVCTCENTDEEVIALVARLQQQTAPPSEDTP